MRYAILLLLASCRALPPAAGPTDQALERRVDALAAALWDAMMERHPLWATFVGDHRFDDQLPDLSDRAAGVWHDKLSTFKKDLEALPWVQLHGEARVTADVLCNQIDNELALEVCEQRTWDVDQLSGHQVVLAELGSQVRITSTAEAELYLTRLSRIPALFAQHEDQLRKGISERRTAPRVLVERVLEQLRAMVATDIAASPYLTPADRAEGLGEYAARFRTELEAMVRLAVQPALDGYREFLEQTYLPQARSSIAVTDWAGGDACYAALIRHATDSETPPAEIHAAGLAELDRLLSAMDEIASAQGFADRRAYAEKLRASPDQYLLSEEALVNHNKALVARAQAALPRAFGRVPQQSVDVVALEAFRAADAPAAYYYAAPDDGSRPARYYINAHEPQTRPLYNMEALAFHEAVPGHHLQIAVGQELPLPNIRRHTGATAFVEGWALYAELLADELGLYSSPATRFGMLNYQAWRAARLVVDTGIHALGWTRQQAIELITEHVLLPPNEIANEVDRYILWPGQALAYMLGRMQLEALRAHAEFELGNDFDVRAFHDALLGSGAVPLNVLRRKIDDWLEMHL